MKRYKIDVRREMVLETEFGEDDIQEGDNAITAALEFADTADAVDVDNYVDKMQVSEDDGETWTVVKATEVMKMIAQHDRTH